MAAGDYVDGLINTGGLSGGSPDYKYSLSIAGTPVTMNVVAGNTVLVFVSNYTTGGRAIDHLADTAGNIYSKLGTVAGGDGNHTVECWGASDVIGDAANGVDIYFAGGSATFIAWAYTQYEGALAFDAVGASSVSPSSPPTVTPPASVAAAGERLCGFFIQWGSAATSPASSGNSTLRLASGVAALYADASASAPGNNTTEFGSSGGTPEYWRATWAFSFGSGPVEVTGSGALTLAPLEVAGAGEVSHTGTGALTLTPLEVAGIGEVTNTGSGAIVLDALQVSGAGKRTSVGSGVIVLGAFEVSGYDVPPAPPTGYQAINGTAIDQYGRMVTLFIDPSAAPPAAHAIEGLLHDGFGRRIVTTWPGNVRHIQGMAVRYDGVQVILPDGPAVRAISGIPIGVRGEMAVSTNLPRRAVEGFGLDGQGLLCVTDKG